MRPTSDSNPVRHPRKGSMALAGLIVAALCGVSLYALRLGHARPPSSAAASQPSLSDYKTFPVYFEQNRGQTDSRVRFLSRGPGYTVFLTRKGTVLALRKVTVSAQPSGVDKGRAGAKPEVKVTTASVWINLAGARSDAQIEGIDPLRGRVNYLIGNDPAQWHSDIPTYARVRYRSVYPGIDLVYYGTPQALEYDLIAAPGANPGLIRMELEGAKEARLDPSGDLVITTAAGDLTMRKPRVYQDTAFGDRVAVQGHYVVMPAAAASGKRTVALALAEHNPRLPLVIDPEIVYSTYLGGKGDRKGPIQGFATIPSGLLPTNFSDGAISLALGPGNTTFITGLAYSSNFPATPGAFQSTNQASPNTTPNGFVAKFDTTKGGAASLVYSTYLGGKGCSTPECTPGHDGDQGTGVAVDSSGDAYVSGLTYSTNFPNPNCGAFGKGNNKGAPDINNGFIAELNPAGSGLVYSCFIHGADGAPASDVAIKPGCVSNCAAYVAGNTTSDAAQGFPVVKAFQTDNPDTNNNSSGYVTVVNGGGGSLMYSSFLGGTGTATGGEALTRIAVDATGRLYVTGASFSSNYPTKNAFQGSNNGFALGVQNAVVSEIDPSKSSTASLLYSTYLGGSGLSILFVGSFGDIAAGIALDSSNHIYVAGVAVSGNFPTNGTKPAFQPTTNSNSGANAFVTELDPGQIPAKQLVYSTYLGGTQSLLGKPIRPGDAATDVAVDSITGRIYLTGGATTTNFPVINTCAPLSTIGASDQADAFVSVLDPNALPASTQLKFSTYLGGSNIDVAGAIARDSTNKIYVAGLTFSGNFPVTGSAYQFGNNAFAAGTTNAFVTKLDTSSTVCPTPIPSPSITITATPKATPTATKVVVTPTPVKATPTPIPVTPHITSLNPPFPGPILVGASFIINGSGFTPGSMVNLFVATAGEPVNNVLAPTKPHSATAMTVPVPATVGLGEGFVSVRVVNTDTGFTVSNLAYSLLQGSPDAGIPSITSINGVPLAATSSNPSFASNNVEIVVKQGTTVTLGGMGFDTVNGVGVDLFCACPPPGKVGPFFPTPVSSTEIKLAIPAKGLPNSPPTGPGSFVVSNAGAGHTYIKKSNAVSAVIGAALHISSTVQTGTTSLITVTGTGFSTLTVINFFNTTSGGPVVNLGGLKPDGHPRIPLTIIDDTKFTFTLPTGTNRAASYVQALSPPFVPFTTSDNDPGGGITLK